MVCCLRSRSCAADAPSPAASTARRMHEPAIGTRLISDDGCVSCHVVPGVSSTPRRSDAAAASMRSSWRCASRRAWSARWVARSASWCLPAPRARLASSLGLACRSRADGIVTRHVEQFDVVADVEVGPPSQTRLDHARERGAEPGGRRHRSQHGQSDDQDPEAACGDSGRASENPRPQTSLATCAGTRRLPPQRCNGPHGSRGAARASRCWPATTTARRPPARTAPVGPLGAGAAARADPARAERTMRGDTSESVRVSEDGEA